MLVNYCDSYSFDFIFAYNKIIDFTIVLIASKYVEFLDTKFWELLLIPER